MCESSHPDCLGGSTGVEILWSMCPGWRQTSSPRPFLVGNIHVAPPNVLKAQVWIKFGFIRTMGVVGAKPRGKAWRTSVTSSQNHRAPHMQSRSSSCYQNTLQSILKFLHRRSTTVNNKLRHQTADDRSTHSTATTPQASGSWADVYQNRAKTSF